MTHDVAVRGRSKGGIPLALVSAGSFGLSGSLATRLMESGWSAGAAVAARVALAVVCLLVPALLALRGQWSLLPPALGRIAAYGVTAVAGCQLAYFLAVQHLAVGVALLIEYTAPVAVLAWCWLAKGRRPSRLTVTGSVIAGLGLVAVLDLAGTTRLSAVGVFWAVLAMVGAASYFVMSSDDSHGLPPIVFAAGGLLVGALVLALAGVTGLVPMTFSAASPTYRGVGVPWWLPVLALGVVSAGVAYTTGIAAARRLGSRLASFVALSEVVAAVLIAWVLLGQLPEATQLTGGLLILAGVFVVKLGEQPGAGDAPGARSPAVILRVGDADAGPSLRRPPSGQQQISRWLTTSL